MKCLPTAVFYLKKNKIRAYNFFLLYNPHNRSETRDGISLNYVQKGCFLMFHNTHLVHEAIY